MFCVVCGKESPLEELRHGECETCYLEKHTLAQLKDHVDVEICVHCHSRRRGEQWVEGHGSLEPVVMDAVREAVQLAKEVERPHVDIGIVPEDERNFAINVVVRGNAEGVEFETPLSTRGRVKNATCVRCSRIQGGYYEAIVQVRATKRALAEDEMRAIRQMASRFIERVVAEGDRNAFVLRDEEIHGGLDIYMGTTNAGRMLAKQLAVEFGGKVSDHHKLVGQKDGLDLVRMTFAVRLPEYKAGDVVVLREEPYRVSSIGGKTVQLADLRSGKVSHVERAAVDKALVLKPEDAKEAVVVSQTDGELQLLDPWTYNTVSVLRPEGMEVGDTVPVIRHEGELLVLRPGKA